MSDLSRRAGVPIATIKYYLREKLLPAGLPIARNQSSYGEQHVRRLQLIRALTVVGGLDLASVREILAAVDDSRVPLPDVYRTVGLARFPLPVDPAAQERSDGRCAAEVDGFLAVLDWAVSPTSSARATFVRMVAALRTLGCGADTTFFVPFARAAQILAIQEIELLPAGGSTVDRGAAVARAVLFDVALASLQQMAREQVLRSRFAHLGDVPAA